jgi:nicotinamide mononucleotide transporter
MTTTRILEILAAGFGIGAVWFNSRQNPLGWPTGLVNVGLYTYLFFAGKLYALMGLQVFFLAISIYGWHQWVRGGQKRAGITVSTTPKGLGLVLAVGTMVAGLGLGWFLDRYTGDRQPYLDAGVSVVSLAAHWMMARKYVETWWIWIGVNLVSVPLFIGRGDYPTAVQYSVFLGLAVSGLVQWRRSLAVASRY